MWILECLIMLMAMFIPMPFNSEYFKIGANPFLMLLITLLYVLYMFFVLIAGIKTIFFNRMHNDIFEFFVVYFSNFIALFS
jgi:hypothetical protein